MTGDLIAGSAGVAVLEDLAGVVAFHRSRGGEVFGTGTITMGTDIGITTTKAGRILVAMFTTSMISSGEAHIMACLLEMVSTTRSTMTGPGITAKLTTHEPACSVLDKQRECNA